MSKIISLFTKAEFVLVSQELLPKFLGLLKELPQIKTIIVFEESHKGPISSYLDANVSCRILTFDEVIEYGYLSEVSHLIQHFSSTLSHKGKN